MKSIRVEGSSLSLGVTKLWISRPRDLRIYSFILVSLYEYANMYPLGKG